MHNHKRNLNHEQMSTRIIKESKIADILTEHGIDPDEMSTLAIGQHENEKPYLNQVIAGQFSADVLDYLPRDSYFTGVEYGRVDIDRLVRSMDIVDNRLAVKDTALYVLEAMVIARYEMFKAVYFHRSVRAAEVMLVRAMQLGDQELGLTDFKTVEEYHQLDDSTAIQRLLTLKDSKNKQSKTAYQLTQDYQDRRLLKCVPYYARQQKPQDIPLYTETAKGTKHPVSFSSLSPLGGTLVGYLDIMRVYTPQSERENVCKVAESKFGKASALTQISY